jgi:hypothetical protein
MNSKVFFVGSTESVGCTFLDWSIHYLAGRTTFYNVKQGLIDLVDNPVKAFNAHLHLKNHPLGLAGSIEAIKVLQANTDFGSFYPYMHIKSSKEDTPDIRKQVRKKIQKEYCEIWNYCHNNQIPLIYVSLNDYPLYTISGRRIFISDFYSTDHVYDYPDQYFDELLEFYFGNDIASYKNYNIWDKRELLAINLHPQQMFSDWREIGLDLTVDHKFINAQQLWTFGEDVVLECLEYLGMPLVSDRLPQWRVAYRDWQQEQKRLLKFVYDAEHIVESVVNNFDFDLRPYNLTLIQESVIQHLLIYKHNVTIKNWQLVKFPDNARDLHKLLEPNFHPVKNLYK